MGLKNIIKRCKKQQIWNQSYIISFVLKKTIIVLYYNKVLYFNFDRNNSLVEVGIANRQIISD
jgi:hypothetical protein